MWRFLAPAQLVAEPRDELQPAGAPADHDDAVQPLATRYWSSQTSAKS